MKVFSALLIGLGFGFLLGYGRRCVEAKQASAEHLSEHIENRLGRLEEAVSPN